MPRVPSLAFPASYLPGIYLDRLLPPVSDQSQLLAACAGSGRKHTPKTERTIAKRPVSELVAIAVAASALATSPATSISCATGAVPTTPLPAIDAPDAVMPLAFPTTADTAAATSAALEAFARERTKLSR